MGVAGAIVGVVVGGIGGRLLMRAAAIAAPERATGAVTENGNRVGDITADGTIELLIFVGLLFGLIGAVAYAASEPWLRWAGRAQGLVFGLVLLAIASPNALDPENPDFALVGSQELVVGMFVALFLVYGIAIPPLTSVLENRLPRVNRERPLTSVAPYLVLVSMGSVMLLPFVLVFFDEEFCGCKPNYLTGVFVVGLGLATLALWLVRLLVGREPPRLMMVGYAALVGAALSGGYRALSDISDILDSGV